jgi:hypothetical protein
LICQRPLFKATFHFSSMSKMFSFFTSKVAPKQSIEVSRITTFPTKPKKSVRINESKNDTILFQDLNAFLGFNSQERHPHTGIRATRISRSGKISTVHILPNGTLMEMRFGQTYPQHRRIFPSYSHWMNFIATH